MSQLSSLKFPYKLFRIVSECKSGCIRWSSDGSSVLISFPMFQKQYLSDNSFFKTHQMSSFVRSLNIYGFEKQRNERRIHLPGQNEYRHKHFVRDCPSYLDMVTRKTGKTKTTILKPKSIFKTKEHESHERKSRRKRSKSVCQTEDCKNSTEAKSSTSSRTEKRGKIQEIQKTWLEWMKEVNVKKEDLDALVKEEERYIKFSEVEFDYVDLEETGTIAIPSNLLVTTRAVAATAECNSEVTKE